MVVEGGEAAVPARRVIRAGETIPHALRALAGETRSGFTFEGIGGSRFVSFAELAAGAASRARHLAAAGVKRGDTVALVIPEPEDFVLAFLGLLTAGVVPVPMYPPLGPSRIDAYLHTATHIFRTSGARAIVTNLPLASALAPFVSRLPGLEPRCRSRCTGSRWESVSVVPFPIVLPSHPRGKKSNA